MLAERADFVQRVCATVKWVCRCWHVEPPKHLAVSFAAGQFLISISVGDRMSQIRSLVTWILKSCVHFKVTWLRSEKTGIVLGMHVVGNDANQPKWDERTGMFLVCWQLRSVGIHHLEQTLRIRAVWASVVPQFLICWHAVQKRYSGSLPYLLHITEVVHSRVVIIRVQPGASVGCQSTTATPTEVWPPFAFFVALSPFALVDWA